ncbi:MAG: hypothetical protein KatS3mg011_1137 [Acidimicrobiia bacterium]|nr:MAG: hypothetical protein KatS3mg011_1137 [Acidimicrobiia bacterium]
MWLISFPDSPGDVRLESPVDSVGGSYTYRYEPALPAFTYTASTPMLEVQLNRFPSKPEMVTVSGPWLNSPFLGGSTFSSFQL